MSHEFNHLWIYRKLNKFLQLNEARANYEVTKLTSKRQHINILSLIFLVAYE